MKDDAVTESITHFIGLFALNEEQSRLRIEYEQFKNKQAAEIEKALLEATSQSRDAPLLPRGFDPELKFKPLPDVAYKAPADGMAAARLPEQPVPLEVAAGTMPPILPGAAQASDGGSVTFHLPPPSSLAAVVVQQNALSDNDTVGVDASLGQAARIETEVKMSAVEDLAEALTPFHLPLEAIDGDWFEIVDTIVQSTEALAQAIGNRPGAVTVTAEAGEVTTSVSFGDGVLAMTTATGAAAQGIHLDGGIASEMPAWQDYLPDLLRDEEDEVEAGDQAEAAVGAEGGTAVGSDPAEHDFGKDFEDGQPGIDPDDLGHHVITGGNKLVNETTIQSTWLDGKVIVVGGDYLRFDGISQTNVLIEKDSAPDGVVATSGGAGSPGPGASETHNFAKIETISRADYDEQKAEEAAAQAAEEQAAAEGAPEPGGGGIADLATARDGDNGTDISVSSTSHAAGDSRTVTQEPGTPEPDLELPETSGTGPDTDPEGPVPTSVFPSNWAVTTLKGDLIQMNWSQQTNFVSDSDTISFSFSGSSTMLSTGENLTINDFNAWELGFQYDLIIVDGHMIDLTIIKQMNILLDSDTLEVVEADAPEAPATATSEPDATPLDATALATSAEAPAPESAATTAVQAVTDTPAPEAGAPSENHAEASCGAVAAKATAHVAKTAEAGHGSASAVVPATPVAPAPAEGGDTGTGVPKGQDATVEPVEATEATAPDAAHAGSAPTGDREATDGMATCGSGTKAPADAADATPAKVTAATASHAKAPDAAGPVSAPADAGGAPDQTRDTAPDPDGPETAEAPATCGPTPPVVTDTVGKASPAKTSEPASVTTKTASSPESAPATAPREDTAPSSPEAPCETAAAVEPASADMGKTSLAPGKAPTETETAPAAKPALVSKSAETIVSKTAGEQSSGTSATTKSGTEPEACVSEPAAPAPAPMAKPKADAKPAPEAPAPAKAVKDGAVVAVAAPVEPVKSGPDEIATTAPAPDPVPDCLPMPALPAKSIATGEALATADPAPAPKVAAPAPSEPSATDPAATGGKGTAPGHPAEVTKAATSGASAPTAHDTGKAAPSETAAGSKVADASPGPSHGQTAIAKEDDHLHDAGPVSKAPVSAKGEPEPTTGETGKTSAAATPEATVETTAKGAAETVPATAEPPAAIAPAATTPAADSTPATKTAPQDTGTAAHPADGIAASLADNMLLNKAEITTIGEDLKAEMDATYQATLESFQAKKEVISAEVMKKPEFEGTETLKVLHITGNFTTTNVVQQTNVLGEDDAVQLAIDEFAAGLKSEMEVTMGSNALANLASVKDSGIDSTIMAKGTGYSDAVLHQAEFVMPEMPEMPDMAAMKSALATEAVAFLADDMMPDMKADKFMADFHAPTHAASLSADVMQTMLA